jgi:hypothetical protein
MLGVRAAPGWAGAGSLAAAASAGAGARAGAGAEGDGAEGDREAGLFVGSTGTAG